MHLILNSPSPGHLQAALLIPPLLALAACGGGSSQPKATEPPDIGSYEDRFDFRDFGEDLDEAVERRDLTFFVDNVALEDVSCDQELPAPPESCAGRPAGATEPAVLLSIWEAEDRYLDSDQYRNFLQTFLTEYADGESDSYGDAAPRLYAYAIIDSELRPSPAGGETVEAIVTRIARTESGGEREGLLISATFDSDRWTVSRLTLGPATFLDPYGPKPSNGGAEGTFEFWSRWQD